MSSKKKRLKDLAQEQGLLCYLLNYLDFHYQKQISWMQSSNIDDVIRSVYFFYDKIS